MSVSLSVPGNAGLVPGTIVGGRYRIDGFLGAGGMGVVLGATHLELNAPVAIKIVRDDLAQHEHIVSRLLIEARAAARMRSAHIVRVLDVARLASGAPYIVMERLDGSDLQVALAERGALPVEEAICYVLQVCEGLSEAHGLGIIHRDLKPENLFLAATPEGVVLKILDFGISKDTGLREESGVRSTLTKAGLAVGSPYYMSPEQMRAAPNLDARADIWSLGAILFELVTGRCPFEGDTPARLCKKVLFEAAPSMRAVSSATPAGLDAIVQRCLDKDPDGRFQTVSQLADALRDFSAASAQPEPTVPPVETEPALPLAPRKTLFALLSVSALLVFAGVAFWHLQAQAVDGARVAPRAAPQPLAARTVVPSTPSAETPRAPASPTPLQGPEARSAPQARPAPRAAAPVWPPRRAQPAPAPRMRPEPTKPPDESNPAARYGL